MCCVFPQKKKSKRNLKSVVFHLVFAVAVDLGFELHPCGLCGYLAVVQFHGICEYSFERLILVTKKGGGGFDYTLFAIAAFGW